MVDSAFVGLGIIVALFPVPGYVARLVQTVQEKRLKKTDARVQSVTESTFYTLLFSSLTDKDTDCPLAMNVLRMVKLFGWEKKMNDRIAVKREEELVWIKRRQFLDLLNGMLKYAFSSVGYSKSCRVD